MSKTWIAEFVSFKSKHPDGEVIRNVVVKAKYKKDGINLAKEELKLFDPNHYDKYRVPVITEVTDEEKAEKCYIDYLALREETAQLKIVEHESASNEVKKPEAEAEAEAELTATIATVAEYPLIEPYAVRLAIAKNGENFVHSMTLFNLTNGARLVGQPDVFNPKSFSNIEHAVVYGLAMAIDAVNKYLIDFIDENQVKQCSDILSKYAHDAEGNFMERYVGDHDLNNAVFMAEPKQKTNPTLSTQKTSNSNEICHFGRSILKMIKNIADYDDSITTEQIKQMANNFREVCSQLSKEYGQAFWQGQTIAKMESCDNWTDAQSAFDWFMNKEMLSALVRKEWLCVDPSAMQQKKLPEKAPVQYYAGNQWNHYIKEIMAQFEPHLIDENEINAAAQNVAQVFNDWKLGLFAEKDHYTTDADLFKDEIYLEFKSNEHEKALELLKNYTRTQDILCDVLAGAFDELALAPKVDVEIKNLVERLLADESLKCPYDSTTIKALIYSELNAKSVEDSTITNPTLKMQWWHNLSADFAKQQAKRIQQNTPDFEMEISPLTVSYHGEQKDVYAFAVGGSNEIRAAADKLDQFDGVTVKHQDPKITPEPISAQEFYGEYLVNPDESEEKDPFEELVATCLQTIDDAHLEIGKEEYAVAGQNVRTAFKQIAAAAGSKIDGEKTITNMQNIDWNSAGDAINTFLDESRAFNIVAECAVIEPVSEENDPYIQKLQEAPTHEPKTTRQDNEPFSDERVTSIDNGDPDNSYIKPSKQLTTRELLKLQMRAANNHIGAVGLGWGYKVKHYWSDGEIKNCEVAIWFRDKNGTESKPISFFGSVNKKLTGDSINDAMTMALINGLDSILFSLGVEVEG